MMYIVAAEDHYAALLAGTVASTDGNMTTTIEDIGTLSLQANWGCVG